MVENRKACPATGAVPMAVNVTAYKVLLTTHVSAEIVVPALADTVGAAKLITVVARITCPWFVAPPQPGVFPAAEIGSLIEGDVNDVAGTHVLERAVDNENPPLFEAAVAIDWTRTWLPPPPPGPPVWPRFEVTPAPPPVHPPPPPPPPPTPVPDDVWPTVNDE